jgi:non-ribosomal peptide synthetase component F
VDRVRATALDSYDRQDAPFERVVDAVQPQRRVGASPIAQVTISWLDGERGFLSLRDLTVAPFALDHRTVKSDLDLEVYEAGGALHVAWFYSTALFNHDSMQWMADDLLRLLESAASVASTRISELPVRPAAERGRLLSVPAAAIETGPAAPVPFVAPRTDLERDVAAVWSDLLGVESIGVHADLFSIGGHSLMAVRMAARLSDQLQLELPTAMVFKTPTIAGMAAAIETLRAEQLEAILADVEGLSDDEARARLKS